MPRGAKPVWILCPRCELNYIKKSDKYCPVCKREMHLVEASEDDIGDLELCPICKINFVQSDQEICDSCRQELGIEANPEDEDKELADWHKYVADDDNEEDDDEDDLTDEVYDKDEVETTSGMDDFDFADDLSTGMVGDGDDDEDLELDDLDDDEDDDDDDFDDDFDDDDDDDE